MTKLTIELNNNLAQKIERLANSYTDKNSLFEDFIKIHQDKIRLKIEKIEKDLKKYEAKYNMSSEIFHEKFEKGEVGDSTDVMIWSGIYEMKLESEIKLKEIS